MGWVVSICMILAYWYTQGAVGVELLIASGLFAIAGAISFK